MKDATRWYALTDEEAAAARITLAYLRRTQIDAEHEAKFAAAYDALNKPVAQAETKGGEMSEFTERELHLLSQVMELKREVDALRAENAALKVEIHAMNRASEYPIVCVGDGGYVLSSNSAAIFVSQEQALRLTEILADELEGEIVVPEVARVVRELRVKWESVPWGVLNQAAQSACGGGWEDYGRLEDDDLEELFTWLEANAPKEEPHP